MRQLLWSLSRRISYLLEILSVIAILILMLVVFIDVLGRSVFHSPLPWGTELLEVTLALMIFLLYPALALNRQHITVDLIKVRSAIRRFQLVLATLIGSVVFAVVAWSLFRQAERSADYGEAMAILGLPLAYLLYAMAILSVVTVLAFFISLVGEPSKLLDEGKVSPKARS